VIAANDNPALAYRLRAEAFAAKGDRKQAYADVGRAQILRFQERRQESGRPEQRECAPARPDTMADGIFLCLEASRRGVQVRARGRFNLLERRASGHWDSCRRK
jgi:hypothetical protein